MRYIISLLVILSAAWLSSCDNDDLLGGTPGKISGHIVLLEATGYRLSDYSGATIGIEGTNITTMSDATGFWSLDKADIPNIFWYSCRADAVKSLNVIFFDCPLSQRELMDTESS